MTMAIMSCSSDSITIEPVIEVGFTEASHTTDEGKDKYQIEISVTDDKDKALDIEELTDVDVFIKYGSKDYQAILGTHFKYEVLKIESKFFIEVELMDDNEQNENREVYFEIAVAGNNKLGTIARCKLTIMDNDFAEVDANHPFKALQGNYIATKTKSYYDKADGESNEWKMRIELDNDDFGSFYIVGFRNTKTRVKCIVEKDATSGFLIEGAHVIGGYDGLELEGMDLTDKKCPLAVTKEEGDDIYLVYVDFSVEGEISIPNLTIGVVAGGTTYAVQKMDLLLKKQ